MNSRSLSGQDVLVKMDSVAVGVVKLDNQIYLKLTSI